MKYGIGLVAVAIAGVVGWQLLGSNGHGHDHADEQAITSASTEALMAREPVLADGEFTIVTSFYPLQFALERIVGERAEVVNVGAGRDPHDYRPSTQDMVRMQSSDVVVLQGAYLEPWGEEVTEQLQAEQLPVVIATEAVELHEAGHDHSDEHHEGEEQHEAGEHTDEHAGEAKEHTDEHADEQHDDHGGEAVGEESPDEQAAHSEDEHEHDHGDYDPHTWLDPILFSEQVAYLVDTLSTLDPDFAAEYEANGAALQTELETLSTQFATQLQNCTYREAIVSHDFLGYVGDRYDLAFHAIAGLSTQDMPSVTTLAELRDEATEGVGAILLEENAIAAYGETLARETGLQTIAINPVAFMIPAGENYLTLQAANATALGEAFGCNE
jgi:zinc transport system substrate-binding protein